MDNNESKYEDAVAKLKILLTASQNQQRKDNDEETGTKSRLFQQNKSGGVARNKHTIYNNEPKLKKKRYNSWHNLSTQNDATQTNFRDLQRRELYGSQPFQFEHFQQLQAGYERSQVGRSGNVPQEDALFDHPNTRRFEDFDFIHNEEKEIMKIALLKQEEYIKQLEQEIKVGRGNLSQVIESARSMMNENNMSSLGQNEFSEFITGLEALSGELKESAKLKDEIKRYKTELDALKVKLDQQANLETEEILALRSQVDVLKKAESEAADQVIKSLKVVEQVKAEKNELEFVNSQLTGQVDRQQTRIRSLIEEQVAKIEEERKIVESRFKAELESLRKELHSKSIELGDTGSRIERLRRSEEDTKRQADDNARIQIQIKEDLEARLAALQIELVDSNSKRSKVERDLNAVMLRHESESEERTKHCQTLEDENKKLRSKLEETEDGLIKVRRDNIMFIQTIGDLEAQLNSQHRIRERLEAEREDSTRRLESDLDEIKCRLQLEHDAREKAIRAELTSKEERLRSQNNTIGELKFEIEELERKCQESSRIIQLYKTRQETRPTARLYQEEN